ncbi:MAG TPA: response regulator [Geomonas sp.]
MLIVCPNCKKRFDIDEGSAESSKKLRCSNCRAVFRLVRKGTLQAPAPASKPAPTLTPASIPASIPAPATATAGRLRVVVANESLAFCEAVRKVLAAEPFELFICNDGKEALDTVERVCPELLLLDVALPTMFGFEVCERVRQNPALSGVKIVLIASIYDKTRYKRSPNSLYGADDYIEKHHIPDSLVPMIYRLASGSVPVPASPSPDELAAQEESRSELRQAEAAEVGEVAEVAETQAQAELSGTELKARRLARIIVSDISLYNQAKVEQGVRDGSFYALLADDIREGELLYRQRVSEEVREATSYLTDAFEDLIAKKRAELRI